MPQVSKTFTIDTIGPVTVTKRANSKRIKLTVRGNTPIVSIPRYIPFKTGVLFAIKNKAWIEQHLTEQIELNHNVLIGTKHRIEILGTDDKLSSRVTKDKIIVRIPDHLSVEDIEVQDRIVKASHRALKSQLEELLAERIELWQDTLGVQPKRIKTKQLTSRWGSCASDRTLTFSIFMAQLPLELVDYIIVHELTHIDHMDHSKQFWANVERYLPDYKYHRDQLKSFKLELMPKV